MTYLFHLIYFAYLYFHEIPCFDERLKSEVDVNVIVKDVLCSCKIFPVFHLTSRTRELSRLLERPLFKLECLSAARIPLHHFFRNLFYQNSRQPLKSSFPIESHHIPLFLPKWQKLSPRPGSPLNISTPSQTAPSGSSDASLKSAASKQRSTAKGM